MVMTSGQRRGKRRNTASIGATKPTEGLILRLVQQEGFPGKRRNWGLPAGCAGLEPWGLNTLTKRIGAAQHTR